MSGNITVQCRLCADFKLSKDLFNVKDPLNDDRNLEIRIKEFLNIDFSDQSLPSHVCVICLGKVSAFYDFREQVSQAQNLLLPFPTAKSECHLYSLEIGEDFQNGHLTFNFEDNWKFDDSDDDFLIFKKGKLFIYGTSL